MPPTQLVFRSWPYTLTCANFGHILACMYKPWGQTICTCPPEEGQRLGYVRGHDNILQDSCGRKASGIYHFWL